MIFKRIDCCLLVCVFAFSTTTGLAKSAKNHCPTSSNQHTVDDKAVRASASHINARKDGKSILRGQVQVEQGVNKVTTDGLVYDNSTGKLRSTGKILYTNCPAESPLWFLSAEEVTYDTKKEKGMIKHAWLHFASVPVLYMPRYRFFNSDRARRSGFLVPSIGNSSESGRELSIPFYINIAGNKDMTVTPTYYSKRGLQINTSARYLYNLERGSLGFSWIDDERFDDERYAYHLRHNADITDKFSLSASIQRTSDDFYLEDFNNSFDVYGNSYLRSHLRGDLFWRGWDISFVTEKLDRSDHTAPSYLQPYQIRPQFSISRDFTLGQGVYLDFASQTTQFINKYSYITNPVTNQINDFDNGVRSHNTLQMQWQYRRPSFYFMPTAGVMHTHYNLYHSRLQNRSHNRTMPFGSIRTGLTFEKDLSLGKYRHTVEPELFYVHVPYRNQNDLPLFDTFDSEFRFARMFDINRFNGVDRIGDENRIAMALNSRVLHKRTGVETLRVSIGKSYYLRDPRVTTTSQQNELFNHESNIASEVSVNLNNKVRLLSSLVWNTRFDRTVENGLRLSLNGANNRSFNLFYRKRYQEFEQVGFGIKLQMFDQWNLFSGVSYDIDSKENLNAFGGVQYQSCCWGLSMGIQRRLKNANTIDGRIADGSLEYENFIGVQLSLKGFGKIGDNINRLAKNHVFFEER